jgi:hypothetical protein
MGIIEGSISRAVSPISTGVIYYVDSVNGSDNNSGRGDWDWAFASIGAALDVAVAGDVIYVAPGDYEEEGLEVTVDNLKILGLGVTGLTRNSPLLIGSGDTILKVNGHNCEISGLGFVQTGAYPAVFVAETAAKWRAYIHDCYFDGYGTCTYGLQLGAASGNGEAVGARVEKCKFISMATACIYNNSENTLIKDCIFQVATGTIGILDVPDGGSRPDRWYIRNHFATIDNTNAIGISFSNTPTAGYVYYAWNTFVNFADKTKCASLRAGYMGPNYDDNALLAA